LSAAPAWSGPFGRLLDRFMLEGIAGYDRDTRRRLAMTNLTGYIAALISLSYALGYAIYDFHELKWVALVNVLSALIALTLSFWHRFNAIAAVVVLVATVFAALMYYVSVLGRDSGIQLNYLTVSAVAFVLLGLKRWPLILIMVGTGTILTIVAHFAFVTGSSQPELDKWFVDGLFVQSVCSCMFIIAVVVWYSLRVATDAEERLERLLQNVLPDQIVDRLRASPDSLIADRFVEASVLFADLGEFTPLSNQLAPKELVELLNEIFTDFDELAKSLNVEKIKTIGDAYMAVCGIPSPCENHEAHLVELALGMQSSIERISRQRGIELGIRIGAACGPMIAGVIGKAKFSYDVWAPAVNLAARLETFGEIGRIHVSREMVEVLEDRFEFELASPREIKGFGNIETWFLIGRKES
ncbi:MAG: adenylate/guanylate cyclase domain-containing protein, partial [Pirellulaceae bacterium]